jgi:manganese efflux pump family protein
LCSGVESARFAARRPAAPVGRSTPRRRRGRCSGGTEAMSPLSVMAIAFAMSTDAFAAAIAKGAALQRPSWREALRTGAIFGVIEAITPLVGWLIGSAAARYASSWDHWIAFVLLSGLGVRMVWVGLKPDESAADDRPERHSFWILAVTGLATSIDALAVGVGLAFVDVAIGWVAAAIGFATFVMVTAGVMLGRVLGTIAGRRAEMLGGLLLVAIGTAILVEHLGAAG